MPKLVMPAIGVAKTFSHAKISAPSTIPNIYTQAVGKIEKQDPIDKS
jgi:hypothetical protein